MKKNITESELKALISESIYEVLNEGEFDEGIGHKLGSAFQNVRNKWRNFKNDFKAGQNDARDRNKDYNAYAIFGDRENDVRNMGNGGYSDFRYNIEKERNQRARGEIVTPNPDIQSQDTLSKQSEKMNALRAKNEKEARAELYKAGLVHQGSYDDPTGWRRKDGQELDATQQNLIRNWKKYKLRENNMRQNTIKITEAELKNFIAESVKNVLNEYFDYRDFEKSEPLLNTSNWVDSEGNVRAGRLGNDDIDNVYNTKNSQINHDWSDIEKKRRIEQMMTKDAIELHPNYQKNMNPFNQDTKHAAKDYVQSGGDAIWDEWEKQWEKQSELDKIDQLSGSRPLHRKGSLNREL